MGKQAIVLDAIPRSRLLAEVRGMRKTERKGTPLAGRRALQRGSSGCAALSQGTEVLPRVADEIRVDIYAYCARAEGQRRKVRGEGAVVAAYVENCERGWQTLAHAAEQRETVVRVQCVVAQCVVAAAVVVAVRPVLRGQAGSVALPWCGGRGVGRGRGWHGWLVGKQMMEFADEEGIWAEFIGAVNGA